jgi:2-oxoglutarate dehydrogenase E1 component
MQESVMQRMWDSAHLSGGNAPYVEELYELYLHDPNAVPEEWRTYFQKLPTDGSAATDVSHSTIRDHFVLLAKNQRRVQPVSAAIRPLSSIRLVFGSVLYLLIWRSTTTGLPMLI